MNIPQMSAYIPYVDPMGIECSEFLFYLFFGNTQILEILESLTSFWPISLGRACPKGPNSPGGPLLWSDPAVTPKMGILRENG